MLKQRVSITKMRTRNMSGYGDMRKELCESALLSHEKHARSSAIHPIIAAYICCWRHPTARAESAAKTVVSQTRRSCYAMSAQNVATTRQESYETRSMLCERTMQKECESVMLRRVGVRNETSVYEERGESPAILKEANSERPCRFILQMRPCYGYARRNLVTPCHAFVVICRERPRVICLAVGVTAERVARPSWLCAYMLRARVCSVAQMKERRRWSRALARIRVFHVMARASARRTMRLCRERRARERHPRLSGLEHAKRRWRLWRVAATVRVYTVLSRRAHQEQAQTSALFEKSRKSVVCREQEREENGMRSATVMREPNKRARVTCAAREYAQESIRVTREQAL